MTQTQVIILRYQRACKDLWYLLHGQVLVVVVIPSQSLPAHVTSVASILVPVSSAQVSVQPEKDQGDHTQGTAKNKKVLFWKKIWFVIKISDFI